MNVSRHLSIPLKRVVDSSNCVVLEGARGAGKSQLLHTEFADWLHVSLMGPSERQLARREPREFLLRLRRAAVIHDAHLAPELFSYLAKGVMPAWPIICVSSVKLNSNLPTLELQHPTLAERQKRKPMDLEMIGRFVPVKTKAAAIGEEHVQGFMLPEKELAMLVPARDSDRLLNFAEVLRRYSGQGLQIQEIADEASVSHRTAVRWLEALEACFVLIRLEALGAGFGRRVIRRPKIHFLRGSRSFESNVVSEIYRNQVHTGSRPRLKYWRDSNGLEIPLLIGQEFPGEWMGVAISETATPEVEGRLRRWMSLARAERSAIIVRKASQMGRKESRILRYEFEQL